MHILRGKVLVAVVLILTGTMLPMIFFTILHRQYSLYATYSILLFNGIFPIFLFGCIFSSTNTLIEGVEDNEPRKYPRIWAIEYYGFLGLRFVLGWTFAFVMIYKTRGKVPFYLYYLCVMACGPLLLPVLKVAALIFPSYFDPIIQLDDRSTTTLTRPTFQGSVEPV
ncbi:uncharacterized protein BDZ99DRAFT_474876 [Mytilinidion resinicola]|uniref:Uncharacterized protein n=1 Tax=Mytilinidion resinicola TaxID=574789 RepID=A0A6A6YXW2_9PEZI|nr:uncharacterized protein BDZ99DRAFT_474876 [Mytilinidion resinicola]KAF2812765.1 hypothetical protein BDZ99DRAFT_474876 [Mytilinidion resinicola]